MNSNRNYHKELEKIIQTNKKSGIKPKLLLHSCCAPCSSYCLEFLYEHFDITVLFYNPNITEDAEYYMRENELERLVNSMNENYNAGIKLIKASYNSEEFLNAVKGYEACKEGGDRCRICFALRLNEAAKVASEGGFDFFTTTLTISPLKNAALLNELGEEIASKYGIDFLPSDFKKNNGYKRSIELSKEYNLYRQNYCGCIFSKNNTN